MISGCMDNQTSADAAAGSMGTNKAAGAMTQAFKDCVNKTIDCHTLLQDMRHFLKKNGYSQVPQMHSEKFVKLDEPFAAYAPQAHKTRDLDVSAMAATQPPKAAPPPHPAASKAA